MIDTHASAHRDYGTIELFEEYWVEGKGTRDIEPASGGIILEQRGIPTRSKEDAENLRRANTTVTELWEDYLTDFQISIAQELMTIRYSDRTKEE